MSIPGWYELVGPPQCGKTTLATLIAQTHDRVAWVCAPQEDPLGIWQAVGWEPAVALQADTVGCAFEMMELCQKSFDLVVLDSLAGLASCHPDAVTIARDVRRCLYDPVKPHLIINQSRHPVPPGGVLYRSVVTSQELEPYRSLPALYTRCVGKPAWLVWWPDIGPKLRFLELDDKLWLADELYQVEEAKRWPWLIGLLPDEVSLLCQSK